jgi:Protein of unknown function (DUF3485)
LPGYWIGSDRPVCDELGRRARSTEYLSRVYESRKRPGVAPRLRVNYSLMGNNLRRTPDSCLPGTGWPQIESRSRVLEIPASDGPSVKVSRPGYSQADIVEHVGFWYYISGEGAPENDVRNLPITSQPSHGRATRGSSMTIEVFYPGEIDPDGDASREFAKE